MIKVKRVYDSPEPSDGFRILVDRLWPRGLSKEQAKVDLWLREVAPSDELRKWFAHDPSKWGDFQKRYTEELKTKGELLHKIWESERGKGTVTLLYSTRDETHNNAVALGNMLRSGPAK